MSDGEKAILERLRPVCMALLAEAEMMDIQLDQEFGVGPYELQVDAIIAAREMFEAVWPDDEGGR